MLSIGLTGGIGTGKSTVALLFVRQGVRLIDFDELAHEVQEPGTPVWREITAAFGKTVLDEAGRIDRAKLGAVVFNDREQLQRLNALVHPAVFSEWGRRLDLIRREDPLATVVSDVPLLVEGGWMGRFDATVLVWASPETQIRRIMTRNGLSRPEARARLEAQMDINKKIPLVDFVIDNDGDLDLLERNFNRVWNALMKLKEENNDRV